MSGTQKTAPQLRFASGSVPFPERGHHHFLPASDLLHAQAEASLEGRPGVWMLRTESGLCSLVPVGVGLACGNQPVIGLVILHHGQWVEIEGKGEKARFLEIRHLTLNAGDHRLGRQCSFCHDRHAVGKSVYCCPLCGEAYCEDCWRELAGRRCCSRSCQFSPGPVDDV
jgi:hypothetical protein